jgi:hypothetical protein
MGMLRPSTSINLPSYIPHASKLSSDDFLPEKTFIRSSGLCLSVCSKASSFILISSNLALFPGAISISTSPSPPTRPISSTYRFRAPFLGRPERLADTMTVSLLSASFFIACSESDTSTTNPLDGGAAFVDCEFCCFATCSDEPDCCRVHPETSNSPIRSVLLAIISSPLPQQILPEDHAISATYLPVRHSCSVFV